ncbi:hypothetical protein DFH07DRAFT_234172 [Mycena maculata]|uniref:Uncharacterized protein n=1 Tax=Mycena maculata TaxID=230809 RepID=A0AAD7HTG5_9AGAR|nr:hypothetical protein DFH07DRAFT_234172 [Mycena maculata]
MRPLACARSERLGRGARSGHVWMGLMAVSSGRRCIGPLWCHTMLSMTSRRNDEVLYLSRGLLGWQALVWLTGGQIAEGCCDGWADGAEGDCPRPSLLHRAPVLDKPQDQAVQHNAPQTVQLAERVAGWNVSHAVVEEEMRRQNSSTIDFVLCLGTMSSECLAARTRAKRVGRRCRRKTRWWRM